MQSIKKKYQFNNIKIKENEDYAGHIVNYEVIENSDGTEKIHVVVKMADSEITFLLSVKIELWEDTRFYNFCEEMQLIEEDGTVNFDILGYDYDVWFRLNQMPNGRFLISEMGWMTYEDEQ